MTGLFIAAAYARLVKYARKQTAPTPVRSRVVVGVDTVPYDIGVDVVDPIRGLRGGLNPWASTRDPLFLKFPTNSLRRPR